MSNISEAEIIDVIVAATPVAYIILDKEFRIHFINDYFTELRQLDKLTTLGDKCYNLSNAGKQCDVCAVRDSIRTGKKSRMLRKDTLPSGVVRYIDDYSIPLYKNDKGEFDYILEIMVNRDEEMRNRKQRDDDFVEIIRVLSTLLETKDSYTAEHSHMVGQLSVRIAKMMGLSQEDIFEIEMAASLHDIGKVFISNKIINKPGKLTDEEFEQIKQHPQKSRDLLESISGFQRVKDYVRFHHERMDETGYPMGLKGEDIPLGARIIAVADAYDAMTSTRSYRKAMTHETAIQRIQDSINTQFDPDVVAAFLEIFDQEDSVEENFENRLKKKFKGVEREIVVEREDSIKPFKELHNIMPESEFIKAIFENAPVGYVILDDQNNVIFANSYFISVMGLEGLDMEGKKCYDFNMGGKKCRRCAMEKALLTKTLQSDKIRQTTRVGEKYFDIYAVPLQTNNDQKLVAEILIDRTEETELRLQHEKDLSTLIKLLSGLLNTLLEDGRRVESLTEISVQIARLLYVPEEAIKDIEIAASLCNIGMVAIGAGGVVVSVDEMYRQHAEKSWEILSKLSGFEKIKEIILHHHEHYDGSGGPDGFKGRMIPLGARIIAIAEYIYRSGETSLTKENVQALQDKSGTLFDPGIIEELLQKL